MGRNRVILTEAELQARKEKYWGVDRNARRQERYHTDEAYRLVARQHVRNAYRNRRAEEGETVKNDDCRESISKLAEIATERPVYASGTATPMLTLTIDEMSVALIRQQSVLYRWINTGLFPTPMIPAFNKAARRMQMVYSVEEAVALLTVMGEHQTRAQYYREAHVETREKLFKAIRQVRRTQGKLFHAQPVTTPAHSAAA